MTTEDTLREILTEVRIIKTQAREDIARLKALAEANQAVLNDLRRGVADLIASTATRYVRAPLDQDPSGAIWVVTPAGKWWIYSNDFYNALVNTTGVVIQEWDKRDLDAYPVLAGTATPPYDPPPQPIDDGN